MHFFRVAGSDSQMTADDRATGQAVEAGRVIVDSETLSSSLSPASSTSSISTTHTTTHTTIATSSASTSNASISKMESLSGRLRLSYSQPTKAGSSQSGKGALPGGDGRGQETAGVVGARKTCHRLHFVYNGDTVITVICLPV